MDMFQMPQQPQHHHHHHLSSSHHNLQQSQQQYQQNDFEPSRIAPSDLANIAHLKRSDSYFMSDELRSEILRKNLLLLAVPAQDIATRKSIFHSFHMNFSNRIKIIIKIT